MPCKHERTPHSDRLTKEISYLIDVSYSDSDKIIFVMDSFNTHAFSSLYKVFPASEACRIAKRLESHYTPTHGSCLNIAEIELNVMTCQCLPCGAADIDLLCRELTA